MLTGVLTILLLAQAPVMGRPMSEVPPRPVLPQTGDEAVLGAINAADASVIEAAKLAASRGGSAEVRAFATTLVREHEASLTNGGRLAKSLNVVRRQPPDTAVVHAHERAMRDLNLLSGSAFDGRFVQLMVDEHRAVLVLLEGSLGATAVRPEVKQALVQAAAMLHGHLAAAEKWQSMHGGAPPA
ncbi:MAG: DUF4142 domain-containing protein [Gemmatimonadota bacterium]